MNKELFGVFGDANRFRRFRSPAEFDRVVEGESITVGVRDPALSIPHRTSVLDGPEGTCVLWGEAYTPADVRSTGARWLLERHDEMGLDALDELNGSYLAVLDRDGDAVVATDPIRSRECFYADVAGRRVFGTDPVAVARTLPSPEIRPRALLELLHLSVVTGNRTLLRGLDRVPFDGFVDRDSSGELDRFVYRPREFDHVASLADRLERAMRRRSRLPGRKALLLSGGYDSRTVLAGLEGIDRAYTIGPLDGQVVEVAARIAAQYGIPHEGLPIDERYLSPDSATTRYGQGIKESIHVHHAGYTPTIEADTIYHALHFDTILRGYFIPRDDVEVFGYTVPRRRLDPDPDVVETVLDRYGIVEESEALLAECDCVGADDPTEFVGSVVEERRSEWSDRYDSIYDASALFGIENQPTSPFRTHLDDTFIESFVAADAELLEWHLMTPPEHRNTRTFLAAIQRIDGSILRHPPHDRRRGSPLVDEVVGFFRRELPFLEPFDPAWPDRRRVYDRRDLDDRLFGNHPELHALPPRFKLRLNDATTWLEAAIEGLEPAPPDLLCPPRAVVDRDSRERSMAAVQPPNE